jgi:hypothetical protein
MHSPARPRPPHLQMITQLFPSKSNVYTRGPVGETVFHTAMLLNTPSTLAIARYLVKLYGPTLVNCPFTERKSQGDAPGAYEGQTALHIAIVNGWVAALAVGSGLAVVLPSRCDVLLQ